MARAERFDTLLGEVSVGNAAEKSAEVIVAKTNFERKSDRRTEELRTRLTLNLTGYRFEENEKTNSRKQSGFFVEMSLYRE